MKKIKNRICLTIDWTIIVFYVGCDWLRSQYQTRLFVDMFSEMHRIRRSVLNLLNTWTQALCIEGSHTLNNISDRKHILEIFSFLFLFGFVTFCFLYQLFENYYITFFSFYMTFLNISHMKQKWLIVKLFADHSSSVKHFSLFIQKNDEILVIVKIKYETIKNK